MGEHPSASFLGLRSSRLASDPKSSKCPVWVELPDLPYHFYQWTDKISSLLGKVLGSRKRAFINPLWHPQILVEIDLELPLMEEIFINCGEYSIKQKVLYKHLPNACFHCGKTGHIIKDFPLKFPTKTATETVRSSPIKEFKGKSADNTDKITTTKLPPPV